MHFKFQKTLHLCTILYFLQFLVKISKVNKKKILYKTQWTLKLTVVLDLIFLDPFILPHLVSQWKEFSACISFQKTFNLDSK